ncbi:hypothetical protein N7510_002650 [Penicillium lagena]|uniref:uncharacterized protein n=1 Tax=Penicillium lagena TaxID=94218 RepID=UPI00253F9EAC|nr:uncharacterized protein N7510_002650 [Penicillium lagena]KAJ5626341.1 hypothetical protein N7510_002650 [Penicillium lagena]
MPKAAMAARNSVRVASTAGRLASGPGASRSHAARSLPAAVDPPRSRPRQSQSSEVARVPDSPPASDSYEKDHPHCVKFIKEAEEEIRLLRERLAEDGQQADSIQQLRGDKARLAAQVGRLNAQVQELQKQLSTATADAENRAHENIQSFLQEIFIDASSTVDKVCSRMNVSHFDQCLAGPNGGSAPLAGPNGQFAMNNYNAGPANPFPGNVDDLPEFPLYPTDT